MTKSDDKSIYTSCISSRFLLLWVPFYSFIALLCSEIIRYQLTKLVQHECALHLLRPIPWCPSDEWVKDLVAAKPVAMASLVSLIYSIRHLSYLALLH